MLFQVSRPARYTNGEWNATLKDWGSTPLKVALCYPDLYEVGMSNLAIHILYQIINATPYALAERVFPPWPDMADAMAAKGIPLGSLESGHPLNQFDVVGFSLGYELTYTNILSVLSLGGIPLFSAERDDRAPLIIAGGSSVVNPEPVSSFIDAFFIGEAEEALPQLLAELLRARRGGSTRLDLLRHLATLPGVYVPRLYQAEYLPDGLFSCLKPLTEGVPAEIDRQIIDVLPSPPTQPTVPYMEIVHDRASIEIARGCTRGCRFCQAGIIYRPVRERSALEVLTAAEELTKNCGYDEISLLSLSTGDYSQMEPLLKYLAGHFRGEHIRFSLPSLRATPSSVRLVDSMPQLRRSSLTLAPETASPRLQRVINKVIPRDELMAAVDAAFRSGNSLKLYFMVGLPTEAQVDIEAIVELVSAIATTAKRTPGRKPHIHVNLASFIPKPHTPFQWMPQEGEDSLNQKYEYIKSHLRRSGVRLSWTDTRVSLLDGVLSRGDRRLGDVVHRAWKLGARFDSWSDQFNYELWLRAFEETGIDPSTYAYRARALDEALPWGHINTGVSLNFLKRELEKALNETPTPDCRTATCHACGLEGRPACRTS